MKYPVIETFTYARDGRTPQTLRAGRSYEINPEHVARFVDEGKIAADFDKIEVGIVGQDKSLVFRGKPRPAKKTGRKTK